MNPIAPVIVATAELTLLSVIPTIGETVGKSIIKTLKENTGMEILSNIKETIWKTTDPIPNGKTISEPVLAMIGMHINEYLGHEDAESADYFKGLSVFENFMKHLQTKLPKSEEAIVLTNKRDKLTKQMAELQFKIAAQKQLTEKKFKVGY